MSDPSDRSDEPWGKIAPFFERPDKEGFALRACRWRGERPFARLGPCRWRAKDDEKAEASAATWIWTAMLRLLIRRLA